MPGTVRFHYELLVIAFLQALYRLLLRCYPRSFRRTFGAEMEAVFADRIVAAAIRGPGSLLRAVWQELRDWPANCLKAHWQARQQRLATAPAGTVSLWDSFLAALPHFLMALLIGAGSLIPLWVGSASQNAGQWLAAAAGLLLLFMLFLSWWRGWPAWAATWWGYFFFIVFGLGLSGPLLGGLRSTGVATGPVGLLSDVALPLLWLGGLYLIVQRWPRAGVVAMLPSLGIAGLLHLEFVSGLFVFLIQASTWAWLGIVAAIMLGWRRPRRNIWLLYLSALLVGAVYVGAATFLREPPVADPDLGRMSAVLFGDLLPLLIPLVGIILLHVLRLWLVAHYPRGQRSFRLLLAGVLLGIAAAQGTFRSLSPEGATPLALLAFALFVIVSLFLIGAGIALLFKHRGQMVAPAGPFLWLLVFLLALLPVVYNVPLLQNVYGNLAYGGAGPVIPFLQSGLWLFWQASYGLGIAWLLLAAWVTGRVQAQLPPAPEPERRTGASRAAARTRPQNLPPPRSSTRHSLAILLVTLLLLAPASWIIPLIPDPSLAAERFNSLTAFLLLARAALTLVVSAVLLSVASRWIQSGRPRRAALLPFATSALLLLKALHSIYWLFIWDSTTDPLNALWLPIPLFAAFVAGALLAIVLPREDKVASAAFTLGLLVLICATFALSQRVGFRQLTAARAQRTAHALATYYARHGRYPQQLDELTPWTTLSVHEPVIIFGQSWCYDGGDDYYRLGYMDREHWSDPRLIGRIAQTAGDPPATTPLCDQQFDALAARYGNYAYTYWKDETP